MSKPIKPYRSHYERYRTWMAAIVLVMQFAILIKVYFL